MSDINAALAGNRAAVNDFLKTAESQAPHWTTPRAPGKWSPSQVVEHLARSYDEGAKLVAGAPNAFPTLPGFVRPIMRGLFFKRILKKGTFMKAKTFKPFDPDAGPSTGEARKRVEDSVARFEAACKTAGPTIVSGAFGTVATTDYIRFQELHAKHHEKQLYVS